MPAIPAKIAFIDDSAIARQIVASALGEAGYETLECVSWDELQQVVEQQHPDLVLVDVQMPRTSGPPMVFVLKKQHPQLKVVYFSSAEEGVLRRLTAETGADGYICKSRDNRKLLQAVARYLDPSART